MVRQAASADHVVKKPRQVASQSGVALLQVLLIAAIISLLAIRFTQTAQVHTKIAIQFEDRTRAQFLAYSALNEVIFSQLVDSIQPISPVKKPNLSLDDRRRNLRLWGTEVAWGEGVAVSVQDMNGLLSQKYPEHELWEQLFMRLGISSDDTKKYIGEWADIQDPDIRSWVLGDSEPVTVRSGGYYLNGYAQNEAPMRWLFSDRPQLLDELLQFSSLNAPFKTNIFHAPPALLEKLFDPEVARTIIDSREEGNGGRIMLEGLLPRVYSERDYLVRYYSGLLQVTVSTKVGKAAWNQSYLVNLRPSNGSPFTVQLDL